MAKRLHSGLIDFEQLEKARLEDEPPETVEVVASHVEHFHLWRRERRSTAPKFVQRELLEGCAHHLVVFDSLVRDPLAYRTRLALAMPVAEFLIQHKMKGLVGWRRTLGFSDSQRIHAAGPRASTVHFATRLTNERAPFA